MKAAWYEVQGATRDGSSWARGAGCMSTVPVHLDIADDGYTLSEEQGGKAIDIAVLQRGAAALLPSNHAIGEASLETAIELAEDWLMPHAARLHGRMLDVHDSTGRLKAGLAEILAVRTSQWTPDEFEELFNALVNLATGRSPLALAGRHGFVADVVLVRELAHHANLTSIRLA